jgi:hypothetical protein
MTSFVRGHMYKGEQPADSRKSPAGTGDLSAVGPYWAAALDRQPLPARRVESRLRKPPAIDDLRGALFLD